MKSNSDLVKAFNFAFEAHKGKCRKGTKIPYIVHPMDVASVLMKNRASKELVIAGLLHDIVEDAGVEIQRVRNLFGERVADLVEGASEPAEFRTGTSNAEKRETWKTRKSHTIEKIKKADYDLKLLSCADKLSNLRDIVNDYNRFGERFWNRLNAPKSQQAWYYRSIVQALSGSPENIVNTQAYKQFKELVEVFFGTDARVRRKEMI